MLVPSTFHRGNGFLSPDDHYMLEMAKSFDKSREWRKLMNRIGDNLVTRNIEDIIWLEDIPASISEDLSGDGSRTMEALERLGKIDKDNPSSLMKILDDIERKDLKKFVVEFLDRCRQEDRKKVKFDDNSKQATKYPAAPLMKPGDFVAAGKPQAKASSEDQGTKAKSSPSENISEIPRGKIPLRELRMTASPRGICLIISNEKFDPHPKEKDPKKYDRPGTCVDKESLERTFDWLGFEVIPKTNCTKDQMLEELKKVAKMDHSSYDAFVCCILSHGSDGKLYGTDWQDLALLELRSLFEEGDCKSLQNKPKIFIMQACRGTKMDMGATPMGACESSEKISYPKEDQEGQTRFDGLENDHGGFAAERELFDGIEDDEVFILRQREEQIDVEEIIAEAGAKTATESDYHGEIIAEAGAKTAPESDYHFTETKDVAKEERFDAVPLAFPGARKGMKRVPSRGNFLFAFPSTQGNKAIINDTEGSWFISTLCKVFQQYAHQMNLYQMLLLIGNDVAAKVSHNHRFYKTKPEIESQLHQNYIYFEPSMQYREYAAKLQKGGGKESAW